MTFDTHPYRAGCYNKRIVQLECLDGCPSARGQPYESRPVFTPGKVIQPMLVARVEKRDLFSRFRVYGMGPGLLIAVARRTRQTQILRRGRPIKGTGDNVICFALDATEPF